jgi:hypothetical protein
MSTTLHTGTAARAAVVRGTDHTIAPSPAAEPGDDDTSSIAAADGEITIRMTGTTTFLLDALHRACAEVSRRAGGPRIMSVIDLSTHHLPESLCNRLNLYRGVSAHFTGWGWLLSVPGNLAQHCADFPDSVPEQVWQLWEFAHRFSAEYILLDADADRIDALPSWTW